MNVPAGTGDWFGGWDGDVVPQADRYANRDRSLFLVTVLPAENMWTDVSYLDEFVGDIETVIPALTRALEVQA